MKAVLGVIGGSGIYGLPALRDLETLTIESPWGAPSAPLKKGRIGTTDLVFLPRHGQGHHIPPSEINYRANIDAMKRAGVTDLVALSACGSFRDDLSPGTFILVDQFVDQTRHRKTSFFETGCVGHVSMADPVSPRLVARLKHAAQMENIAVRVGGTYLAIEGPQFSSRAESLMYRKLGMDVVGMTAMPEAKLAREAELSYALLAMVTDYDCWHEAHEKVDARLVLDVMQTNIGNALKIIACLAADFPDEHEACPIGSDRALDQALVTDPDFRNPDLMRKLEPLLRRALKTKQD